MFGFNKKKPKLSVNSDMNLKIEVEDLLDQNFTCSQISNELGIERETVYRIKEARRKRYQLLEGKEEEIKTENPVIRAKQELEAMRLEIEKDKLEFEREKLRAEREEYFEDPMEGAIEEAKEHMSPTEQMLLALASGFLKQPQQQPQPQQTLKAYEEPKPQVIEQPKSDVDSLLANIPKGVKENIRKGIYSKEFCWNYIKEKGISEDVFEEGYARLMKGE